MLRTDRSAENASTTPFKLTEQGVVMGLRPDVSEFVPKVLQLWRRAQPELSHRNADSVIVGREYQQQYRGPFNTYVCLPSAAATQAVADRRGHGVGHRDWHRHGDAAHDEAQYRTLSSTQRTQAGGLRDSEVSRAPGPGPGLP
eukprot:3333372-Rhodomonas_salina.2